MHRCTYRNNEQYGRCLKYIRGISHGAFLIVGVTPFQSLAFSLLFIVPSNKAIQ